MFEKLRNIFKRNNKEVEEFHRIEEEKRLAEAAEKKKAYQERKAKILAYLKVYETDLEVKSKEIYEAKKKEVDEKNSTCPKCGSKNVVHKVVRTKGEIHGTGSSGSYGSIGGSLFGFAGSISSYGHSSIDGELDTLQVNRCKDCEEEWNIEELDEDYGSVTNAFSNYDSFKPGFLFRRIEEYYEMKYDPYDVKNECNSLEEMREAFFNRYSTSYYFEEYKKCPRYMIEYALYKGFTEHYYGLEDLNKKLFNYKENDDQYSYTMSDEMWELVKKIIGWEGIENKTYLD